MSPAVAVVGAGGFVGGAVCRVLRDRGIDVVPVRLRVPACDPAVAAAAVVEYSESGALARQFAGLDAVVNAAGLPDAGAVDVAALTAANAVVPGLVARAARAAGVPRAVQVSSAVVQGRLPVLDGSAHHDAFSSYARSKSLGERLFLDGAPAGYVAYRPPSVHDTSRRVSRTLARLAASPLATVAAPPDAPTPQALIDNVAAAIVHLATTPSLPPPIVHHPWEGLTTASLLAVLGRRQPRVVPRPVARAVIAALALAARVTPRLAADARRVEMVWFGQPQAPSWLTGDGWAPPAGAAAWEDLGDRLRRGD